MNENGTRGEQFAAETLSRDGYEILARNYRTRRGELDLVASKEEILAFVEVKTRSVRSLGSPASAVTPTKQRCLIRAALDYLARYPNNLQPRFDVFEVVTHSTDSFAVVSYQHLKGAFILDETNRID